MDVESASLVSLLSVKARWGVRRRGLIVALVCLLVASLVSALASPAAAVAGSSAVLPSVASVPVSPVVARVDNTPSPVDAASVTSSPVVVWPSGGAADLAVPAAAGRAAVAATSVGGLPVGVHAVASAGLSSGGGVAPDADAVPAGTAVSSVRVEVAGREAAVAAGVSGVLFSLSRADGSSTAGAVGLDVSYASFREAFGGDYASRLRLVSLPGCALTDPGTPTCQVQTLVPGGNNALSTSTLSAGDVAVGPAGSALARVSSEQRREWADAVPLQYSSYSG